MADELDKKRFSAKAEITAEQIEDNDIGIMTHKPMTTEEGDRKWKFSTIFEWIKGKLKDIFVTPTQLNESLANYIGQIVGSSTDFNDYTVTGLYKLNGMITNRPKDAGYYQLMVWVKNNDVIFQQAIHDNTNTIFIRKRYMNTWSSWEETALKSDLSECAKIKTYTINSFTCDGGDLKILISNVKSIGVNWTTGWSAFVFNRSGFSKFSIFGDGDTLYFRNLENSSTTGTISLCFCYS